MLNYRYQALDASGNRVEGEAQGLDEREVARGLARRGLIVQHVSAAPRFEAPQPIQAPPVSRPAPRAASPPADLPGRASDGQRQLVYAQLASYLRAGLNPVRALHDVASRTNNAKLRDALEQSALAATRGEDFSLLMERSPGLFPEGDAGMLRAGLRGGFLPEALEKMAERADANHRLNRFLRFWVWVALLTFAIGVPFASMIGGSLRYAWRAAEATGGNDPTAGLRGLGQGVVTGFLWPWGPIGLGGIALLIGASYWLSSPRFTRLRHSVSLSFPIFGERARKESMSWFSFALSKLSAVGMSPRASWLLAAQAVPNVVLSERLQRMGQTMHEAEKLSDAVRRVDLVPHEHWAILQTAEITGDVPGALGKMSGDNREQFDHAQRKARTIGVVWGILFMILASVIAFFIFYRAYFGFLFGEFLEEASSLIMSLVRLTS